MRISDWRADVCSSDLGKGFAKAKPKPNRPGSRRGFKHQREAAERQEAAPQKPAAKKAVRARTAAGKPATPKRSEEHTSELQSLMRLSYAVFCLKKKNTINIKEPNKTHEDNAEHNH